MQDVIELAIDTQDGIADCRVERIEDSNSYSVTILYPHIYNGLLQSKVYEHTLNEDGTGNYHFADKESMHPRVLALEEKINIGIRTA